MYDKVKCSLFFSFSLLSWCFSFFPGKVAVFEMTLERDRGFESKLVSQSRTLREDEH